MSSELLENKKWRTEHTHNKEEKDQQKEHTDSSVKRFTVEWNK